MSGKGPLDGLRLLEFCSVLSGPWAGRLLADLGMEVIKVEPPSGDIARRMGPWRAGVSSLFLTVNHGKRSVCVNLKARAGREVVYRMVEHADAVLENWRPGVAERLGLGMAELRGRNPRLVTASLRGFSEQGPRSRDRVYDPIIQGITGLARLQGSAPDQPQLVRTHLADKLGSLAAAQGILAALVGRERTGVGTHVEASLYASTLTFLWPDMLRGLALAGADEEAAQFPQPAPAALVRVADDGWIVLSILSDAEWRALCNVVGRADWIEEYRDIDHRRASWELVETGISEALRSHTRGEALALLGAAGVPCAPVLFPIEALADVQAVADGLVSSGPFEDDADGAEFRWVGPFVKVGEGTASGTGSRPPRLGEHTAGVLTEFGFSEPEVDDLVQAGALIRE